MVTKSTKTEAPFTIDGKKFIWQPLDDDDVRGNMEPVVIPMRIKLKTIRGMTGRDLDADTMFEILEKLIPGQADALDEMDLADFQECFTTWQAEYQKLNGATLGE